MRLRSALSMAALATVAMSAPLHADKASMAKPAAQSSAINRLLDYARNNNSTGLLVVQNGRILLENYWPAPDAPPLYKLFVYGSAANGVLLEDVASQQKSFVAVLIAIAEDKGLIDVTRPVSSYIGPGWSKASADQEGSIRVVDLMTMSSGLDDQFRYVAKPGALFHYNTPVYAVTKRVLAAAAKQSLETLTRAWLTEPAGMRDTAWRKRPAALASVGNDTGLVTTLRDTAIFGAMVMNEGLAVNGKRIVSSSKIKSLFQRSATNPAYGRLWWLNGSAYAVRAAAGRSEGPLVSAAPADMVGAFGAFHRRLYIVPSRKLIVIRTGADSGDKDFDQQLWLRLNAAFPGLQGAMP